MKKLFLAIILVATNFSIIFAGPFDSEKWINTYYKNPTPEKFTEAVRDFSQKELFKEESSRVVLEAFLAAIMFKNPSKVQSWLVELGDLPQDDLNSVYAALVYSKLEFALDLIRKYTLEQSRPCESLEALINLRPPIYELPLSPAVLDMNWGVFLCHGRTTSDPTHYQSF